MAGNKHDGYWTDARIEELKRLVAVERLSYQEIAARWGVTKNVPLAKAYRLGIVHPASPLRKRAARRTAATKGIAVAAVPQDELGQVDLFADVPHEYLTITTTQQRLDALNNKISLKGCRFPIGHPKDADFHTCGEKASAPGEPYCSTHRAVAWTKTNPDAQRGKFSLAPLAQAAE